MSLERLWSADFADGGMADFFCADGLFCTLWAYFAHGAFLRRRRAYFAHGGVMLHTGKLFCAQRVYVAHGGVMLLTAGLFCTFAHSRFKQCSAGSFSWRYCLFVLVCLILCMGVVRARGGHLFRKLRVTVSSLP